jgi:hypothetical protein
MFLHMWTINCKFPAKLHLGLAQHVRRDYCCRLRLAAPIPSIQFLFGYKARPAFIDEGQFISQEERDA